MTATASGGTNNYGVCNDSAPRPGYKQSKITGSGGTNSYGVFNDAPSGTYTVTIENSTLTGTTNTIRNDAEFTTSVGASQLSWWRRSAQRRHVGVRGRA